MELTLRDSYALERTLKTISTLSSRTKTIFRTLLHGCAAFIRT